MDHDQGVLHTIPIPEAMAYVLLRPLLADVPADDMCGVKANQVLPITDQWHSPLLAASSGIPDVRAGDTVWWHSDMIHGVAPVAHQQGWGNVMYIPAAPSCARNETYADSVRDAHRIEPDRLPESTTRERGATGSRSTISTTSADAVSVWRDLANREARITRWW
jgi:hypothetical protein